MLLPVLPLCLLGLQLPHCHLVSAVQRLEHLLATTSFPSGSAWQLPDPDSDCSGSKSPGSGCSAAIGALVIGPNADHAGGWGTMLELESGSEAEAEAMLAELSASAAGRL